MSKEPGMENFITTMPVAAFFGFPPTVTGIELLFEPARSVFGSGTIIKLPRTVASANFTVDSASYVRRAVPSCGIRCRHCFSCFIMLTIHWCRASSSCAVSAGSTAFLVFTTGTASRDGTTTSTPFRGSRYRQRRRLASKRCLPKYSPLLSGPLRLGCGGSRACYTGYALREHLTRSSPNRMLQSTTPFKPRSAPFGIHNCAATCRRLAVLDHWLIG